RLLPRLNTLALAANQYVGNAMRRLSCLGQRCEGTMPAGVVGVVAGGSAFSVVALATGSTMQNNLVRPSQPVFVNKEIMRIGRCGGSLGDQAHISGNFLDA